MARTFSGIIAFTVAAVPTGIKAGVLISPRGVVITPVRAFPEVAESLNENLVLMEALWRRTEQKPRRNYVPSRLGYRATPVLFRACGPLLSQQKDRTAANKKIARTFAFTARILKTIKLAWSVIIPYSHRSSLSEWNDFSWYFFTASKPLIMTWRCLIYSSKQYFFNTKFFYACLGITFYFLPVQI